MTDRELLEKAAKAAGMPMIGKWTSDGYELPSRDSVFDPVIWNPITDDGDALRLAVRLEIPVNPFAGKTVVGRAIGATESWDDIDPQVATRRAIVRAAAALGDA